MNDSVLVLGASIAGMRACAELVQQGFKAYLVEKEPQIGGNIEALDALFPEEECAACALQPLMLELINNPNATLLTSAELLTIQGKAGDFTAEVLLEQTEAEKDAKKMELRVGAVIATFTPPGLELDGKGVFVFDPALGQKGVGEAIIQACATASQVASLLAPGRKGDLDVSGKKPISPIEATDEPKIAVVYDQGDAEVKDLLDLDELVAYAQSLPGVVQVEVTPCAFDGSKIQEMISTGNFNRLVVAGPSPIPHEGLFQRHAANAGLNPYLLEIVNLHKQCAQVHANDKQQATAKAKTLIKIGVARVRLLEPLEELKVDITQNCLVIGGSTSGVACAVRLAEIGIQVQLVDSSELSKPATDQLSKHENIILHTPATVEDSQGCLGNFQVTLNKQGQLETVTVGAIVIASGTSIAKNAEGSPVEESLALEKDADGFYKSTQGIMNLLDFSTEGVFLCGEARAALEIDAAVIDGEAAASRAACIIASPMIIRSPAISSVVNENCDGCAYCIDPCPTNSLTLLEYAHKDSIKKVAELNEVTCIGCGICMSTCPKKGILVKHYKLESFSEMAQAALADTDFEPSIISFCCSRCAYPGADGAGVKGLQYPASVKIIRSVCSGMIHPNIIIDALTQWGADGVLLCGCHPGNCRSRDGILKAQARTEAIELMMEDFALEPERFRLEFIAASEAAKFAKVIQDMTEELSGLGPNPYKG